MTMEWKRINEGIKTLHSAYVITGSGKAAFLPLSHGDIADR